MNLCDFTCNSAKLCHDMHINDTLLNAEVTESGNQYDGGGGGENKDLNWIGDTQAEKVFFLMYDNFRLKRGIYESKGLFGVQKVEVQSV